MEVWDRPTLGQVFRRFYHRYRQDSEVTPEQRKVAWCVEHCRTPALGSERWECERCQRVHTVYHSCGNRHCPVCQAMRSFAWLEREQEHLLPVPYFHVVFTLPTELQTVVRYNRRKLYQEFFAQSSGTLQAFAKDRQWLGAQLGFMGILHTWGQTLVFHPHIHYIVPQGGLDQDGHWVTPRLSDQARFLLPIQAVSRVFRARFLRRLEQLHAAGQLRFPDPLTQSEFPDQLRMAAAKRWEVYAQRPFAGPEPLLRYLSLYTHRAAITSGRLVQCDAHSLTFRYKDYRNGGRIRTQTLGGEVFIGRFLNHVAPHGFRRIRYYGFLANAAGRDALRQVQSQWLAQLWAALTLLEPHAQSSEPSPSPEGSDWTRVCPACGGGPLQRLPLPIPSPVPNDTS